MDSWIIYSQVKVLINEFFELQEGKKYEDFIRDLNDILKI